MLCANARANPLGGLLLGALIFGAPGAGRRARGRALGLEECLWPRRGRGVHGSYTVLGRSGIELARLKHRFGSLSVAPSPDAEHHGSPDATPVRWEGLGGPPGALDPRTAAG